MAGYQFLHVEGYSRSGTNMTINRKMKPKKGDVKERTRSTTYDKWSIDEIADEALRVEGACDHVESPAPPNVVFGAGVREAVADASAWAESATDSLGRKYRQDGLCMLSGVISLPRARINEWPAFRDASIEWLKAKYGDRLRCAVEHLDEAHPHLHFYAVPLAGERFEALHEGKAAVAKLKAEMGNKVKKGEQNTVYRAAMRSFQDDFWMNLAANWSLTRKGPGRRRLGRAEWILEQGQAEATAGMLNDLKSGFEATHRALLEEVKEERQSAASAAFQAANEALKGFYDKLQAMLREVISREKAVVQQENDLKTRMAEEYSRLQDRELALHTALDHRHNELDAREAVLNAREESLNDYAERHDYRP